MTKIVDDRKAFEKRQNNKSSRKEDRNRQKIKRKVEKTNFKLKGLACDAIYHMNLISR